MTRQRQLFRHTKKFDPTPYFAYATGEPVYRTDRGALFEGDCLEFLPAMKSESIDTVFADPPFNIGKQYGPRVNNRRRSDEYLGWCHQWIDGCIGALKRGGALFVYNIPKWNIQLGYYLTQQGMQFRDWIAIDIKFGFPIRGRLYPSHYSLLYYTKGPHKTFHNIRTPIKTCRHCGKEVKDYGGHRGAMNPKGVNLTDVWDDIPPVRHWKFKSKKRKANCLSTKLLERVVRMTTDPGDILLDPFGGSGTTYAVCEMTERNWIGMELESTDVIVERREDPDLRCHSNGDHHDD